MNKTRILIVEDESIVAADLAGKLQQLGYEVAGMVWKGLLDRFLPVAQVKNRTTGMPVYIRIPSSAIAGGRKLIQLRPFSYRPAVWQFTEIKQLIRICKPYAL